MGTLPFSGDYCRLGLVHYSLPKKELWGQLVSEQNSKVENLSVRVTVNVLMPRAVILLNKVVVLRAFTLQHRLTPFAVRRNVTLQTSTTLR